MKFCTVPYTDRGDCLYHETDIIAAVFVVRLLAGNGRVRGCHNKGESDGIRLRKLQIFSHLP